MRPKRLVLIIAIVILASGCAGQGTVAPSHPAASTSPVVAPSSAAPSDPWVDALDRLDAQVRATHPNPFAIHPESEWVAKLAELKKTLPSVSPDEQIVQLAGLIGLLDSHTSLIGPFRLYPAWMYRFPEGWFVVLAKDPSLVGSRLVSIGGTPIEQVERALRPLVAADNETGKLPGMQDILSLVEFLHGLGFVDDPTKPGFVFEKPGGAQVTVDLMPESSGSEFGGRLIGYLMGDATEAVARRREPVWTRLDKPTKTFLISYNDYTENDLPPALAAMKAALDAGSANRVVLDMRYIRGGNGGFARPLIDALKGDKRVNRPGGLTVLIGRENASAATVVAGALDRDTEATLIGEPTPARADNFLCDCVDIPIGDTGLVATLPTQFLANGDKRDAVLPDIPLVLTAADFFAGRDPVLDLALSGAMASPSQ